MISKCCNASIKKEPYFTICSYCLKTCKTKYNINSFKYIFLIIFPLLSYTVLSNSKIKIHKGPYIQLLGNQDIVLEDSIILKELKDNKILFPEIVLAQAHLETGNFTSQICKENHNLFGIKYINRKPFQVKELNNHCYYNSYKDCIKDYKLTQQYYLANIDKRYAEDSNYSQKLKQIKL